MKHTPGPWKIEYSADDDVIIVSDVTKVTVAADIATWADAVLMKTAPDMLAVLISIDGRYQTGDVTMGADLYRYLRDVIAKATNIEAVS